MEVVFGSILYEISEEIIRSFFTSLLEQDDQEFDILLINDHLNELKLNKILEEYSTLKPRISVINAKENQTFWENRCLLITEAKKRGYVLLVRGDFDDSYAKDKISSYKKQFDESYGFFYNDIELNDESIFEDLPVECTSYKQIGQYNFLGEGACGINLHQITDSIMGDLSEGKTRIFDWYLFTTLLLNGLIGKMIDGAYTYYHIYENNMAGIPKKNEETINREIDIKRLHYGLLKDKNAYFNHLYNLYSDNNEINITEDKNKYYWWQFTFVEE